MIYRWTIRRTLVEVFDVYAATRQEAIRKAYKGAGGSFPVKSSYTAKREEAIPDADADD